MFIRGFFIVAMLLTLPVSVAYAADEEKKPESIEYYELKPLTVPVVNDKGLVQQISVSVSLECVAGKKDKVASYKPKLTDAYLRELYGALGAGHALMRGDIVDVENVRARLTTVTERVLGPDMVSDVLLQSVFQYKAR